MALSTDRINAVARDIEEALGGSRQAAARIKDEAARTMGLLDAEESHSTSDFPAAMRSVIRPAFLGEYAQIESVYPQYTRRYDVTDLKPSAFYSLVNPVLDNLPSEVGGYTTKKDHPGGLPLVPELTEFPTISFSASESSFGVAKFGARVDFSFEMLLNDEWGALEGLPRQLAQLARNQEDIVATEVLVNAAGFNSAFIDASKSNILAGNPELSLDSIQAGIAAIKARTFRGNPVQINDIALMVPPSLEMEARRLLAITSLVIDDPVNGKYNSVNPISGVKLIVNPWLTYINKSANAAKTWFLVPFGANGVRPSMVFSKLRGRGEPELRMSNATGVSLGGGAVSGREGSFTHDNIEFRVRHFVGAAGIAPETVAASNGSKS